MIAIDDFESIAARLSHAHGCPDRTELELLPPLKGETRERLTCIGCGRWVFVYGRWLAKCREALGMPATVAPDPQVPQGRAGLTTYWCTAHGERVSWHGRDCPQCRAEHDARHWGHARRADADVEAAR